MSIGKMTGVSVTGDASVTISWDDGHIAGTNLAPVIAGRQSLASLADPRVFAQVKIADDGWSLVWTSGIDFDTAQLRRWADEQAGNVMPLAAFRDWVRAQGLTPDQAAIALGLSNQAITAYLSGEQPVPKTVMLGTEGYGHRAAA